MEPLLAKSAKQPLLSEHLTDTDQAACLLFGPGSRWESSWLRFFRVPEALTPQFLPSLRVAALLHDIGKANADFQDAVRNRLKERAQALRHEHLSALIMVREPMWGWLHAGTRIDVNAVCAAVLSHHAKAAERGTHAWGQAKAPRLALKLDDPSLQVVLRRIAEIAALPAPPDLPWATWSEGDPEWERAWQDGVRAARVARRNLRRDHGKRALVLAVKAGLVVADAASSGLVREGHDLSAWLTEVVSRPPVAAEEVAHDIIEPRIRHLAGDPARFGWKPFQEAAARAPARSLLVAGCGAGKTLAAWRWAEAHLRERPAGAVVFLYPTRGTATEGFRDYVGWAPEAKAALVSGTARYELEGMRENPSAATRDRDHHISEAEQRLFGLRLWSKRFFSATVDQFLAFMEHGYAGLCALPVLADSVVVIDEVHAFDRRMFNDLIAFLKAFDVPVLCMTATLPRSRRDELVGAGLELVSAQTLDLQIESEMHPRYEIETSDGGFEAALSEVLQAREAGLRVLWVVNTVRRCHEAACRLQEAGLDDVLVYHSRFRLEDRQARHAEVIEAFRAPRGDSLPAPAVAVTTQVCEMSLDLDADVLVTELAPCEALVQRFGRANRHLTRGPNYLAQILVTEPEREVPYDAETLRAARTFLASVSGRAVSQRELAEELERHAPAEPHADGDASFLGSGWYAVAGSFRDAQDHTRAAVLASDLGRLRALRASGKPYDGLIIQAPRAACSEASTEEVPRFLRVVDPRYAYDPRMGLSPEREELDVQ